MTVKLKIKRIVLTNIIQNNYQFTKMHTYLLMY